MNNQPIQSAKRSGNKNKVVSNITVDKDGGVQLDLNNPETTRKLFDIVEAFRKARPVLVPRK